MPNIIGIDLGTTYCVVSYVDQHGHPETLLNTEGQPLTASALWIDEDDNLIVGQLALDNAIAFPEAVITMAKRSMGQDVKLKARGKEFTPQEVSAVILKKLKQDAERHFKDEAVTDAVITCPAFFGAAETQATEEAGKMAGFNVRRIFPEPAAAALAFGYDNPTQEQTLLVYDLGGGTFDITLFKIGRPDDPQSNVPKIEMISTEGDRALGGADWNGRIVDWVAAAFVEQQGKAILVNALKDKAGSEEEVRKALDTLATLPPTPEAVADELAGLGFAKDRALDALQGGAFDPRTDPVARQDLYLKAERAKRALARVARTTVVCQHAGMALRVDLSREKFEELTADLLASTERAIDKLLEAKKHTPDQIDQVLCAGGSTRMSMVRDMLQRKFPGKVNTQIEPDLCVGQGAARLAKLIEGGQEPRDEISISPHAYGILARGENDKPSIYPVILKDQKLPCASAKPDERSRPDYDYGLFYTATDRMTRVMLEVFEFDALAHQDLQEPESCRKIGSVIIDDLPPNRPRGQQVFATFELDKSLQLTVSALDVSSGKTISAQLTLGDTSQDGIRKNAARASAMSKMLQDTEIKS
jgi:molecular chaperone DnaK